jgi:predicted phosphodiesterase
MIFVTGDTHANLDIGKLSTRKFPEQKELTKEDFLIVCGDFGLVWDGSAREIYWQDWLSDKNFTTLWIDGNHENFDILYEFPLVEKFGGKVREIAPDIYHLDRGQVLTIDNQKIFVMGGARSHDREHRIEHISWWEQEMPTSEEMERAIEALDRCEWGVDYVITHCAPKSVQKMVCSWYESDPLVSFLERVHTDLKFKRWYFGHYHIDRTFGEQFEALYNRVIPME